MIYTKCPLRLRSAFKKKGMEKKKYVARRIIETHLSVSHDQRAEAAAAAR